MRVNEIIELFQSKGVKATPQRISVYEALLSLKHPSAEAVLERVRSILPTVTVATVYNTLDCFAKAGVIERVLTVDNKMYFDTNLSRHYHLYSEETHEIQDFYDNELSELIRTFIQNRKIPGFELKDVKEQLIGNIENY